MIRPMAQRVLDFIRRLNRWVALLIGIVLLFCAVFVLTEIVVRKMGVSLGGADEISGYVMAIVTSWGMAFALLELGHVRIDLLRVRMKPKGRVLIDLSSMFILSITVTLIALRCWPVVERSMFNGSRANTPLETPLTWVQLPWFAGWVWFAVIAWLTMITATILVLQSKFTHAEAAVGIYGDKEASI